MAAIGSSASYGQSFISPTAPAVERLNRVSPYTVLLSVGDVARARNGGIVVTDPVQGAWYWLDQNLRLVLRVGKPGGSFGEFRALQSIRTLGYRTYTLDTHWKRIYVYEPLSAPYFRSPVPVVVPLDFTPIDLCPITQERAIVLGERDGMLLHEIDLGSGRVVRSGLPVDPSLRDVEGGELPEGWISCSPRAREFIVTWAGLPVVDVVSAATLHLVARSLLPADVSDRAISALGRAFIYKGEQVIQASVDSDVRTTPETVFVFHRGLQSPPRVLTGHSRLFPIGGDSAVMVTVGEGYTLEFVKLSEFFQFVKAK